MSNKTKLPMGKTRIAVTPGNVKATWENVLDRQSAVIGLLELALVEAEEDPEVLADRVRFICATMHKGKAVLSRVDWCLPGEDE